MRSAEIISLAKSRRHRDVQNIGRNRHLMTEQLKREVSWLGRLRRAVLGLFLVPAAPVSNREARSEHTPRGAA